jgi:hypothetical protein
MEAIVTDDTREVTEEEGIFAQALNLLNEARANEDPLDYNRKITEAISLLTASRVPEINNYHFTMGNTETGVIGMACHIIGSTRERAAARLQKILLETVGAELNIEHDDLDTDEYIIVYLSPENVDPAQIDRQHQVE